MIYSSARDNLWQHLCRKSHNHLILNNPCENVLEPSQPSEKFGFPVR